MPDILLKIVMNEQHEKRTATSRKILTFLLEHGIPGATMKRGEAGMNYRGELSYDLLEDSYFNDLPITIESVMDAAELERIEGGLRQMISHGQISKVKGCNAMEADAYSHSFFAVKVYTKESSNLMKRGEYEKVLRLLQKQKAAWATVTKAIAGYGSDHVIYGQHIFSPSEHLPLIIEFIIEKEKLSPTLDELKSVVSAGAVFIAPVDLIINE